MLQEDLLTALEDGEQKLEEFFNERVFSRTKEWGITKSSRKTFLSAKNEKIIPASTCKNVKMENEAMEKVISKCFGNDMTLTDILQHRVTDECLSIFNTNGENPKIKVDTIIYLYNS